MLGEYNKNSADPFSGLYEKLRGTAFNKHTYEHAPIGFLKDIEDMPNQYDYSLEFYRRYYRPEYTTIVLVGDLTRDEVGQAAFRRLAARRLYSEDPGRARAKGAAHSARGLAVADAASPASALAPFIALRRTPETINQLFALYQSISPKDILAAASQYFVDDHCLATTIYLLATPRRRSR